MVCKDLEDKLAAAADGGATQEDTAAVAQHVASCEACGQALYVQTTARSVLRARAAQLAVTAPPGLRTRIAATARAERAEPKGALSWSGRLSAFAAAAVLMLTLGAALLPMVTERSTVVLAAQLALDHLKCFVLDGDASGPPVSKADAEAIVKRDHGWNAVVPASMNDLALLAVRKCLYGDGFAAHVLYRADGQPVSLFILPGLARPAAEVSVLGHDVVVWTHGDRTYLLVSAAGTKAGLASVASYLQNEAR